MNRDVHSVECAHGFHTACDYQDCACDCHLIKPEPVWDDFEIEPDEFNTCHHGVGFDVECEACERESLEEDEEDCPNG